MCRNIICVRIIYSTQYLRMYLSCIIICRLYRFIKINILLILLKSDKENNAKYHLSKSYKFMPFVYNVGKWIVWIYLQIKSMRQIIVWRIMYTNLYDQYYWNKISLFFIHLPSTWKMCQSSSLVSFIVRTKIPFRFILSCCHHKKNK